MKVTALEALEKRRTKKNYDSDKKIPKEQLDKILNAELLSTTVCDYQGEDFIVVINKETLVKL